MGRVARPLLFGVPLGSDESARRCVGSQLFLLVLVLVLVLVGIIDACSRNGEQPIEEPTVETATLC